jgi:hypothetical protein
VVKIRQHASDPSRTPFSVESVSKGATSSTSMPTSPNYFDLLFVEEDHPETAPRRAPDPRLPAMTVRFADPPQVHREKTLPLTSTTAPGPPPLQTKQKKSLPQPTQPSTVDRVQPHTVRPFGLGAWTPRQPPLARESMPKPHGKQMPFSGPSSSTTRPLKQREHQAQGSRGTYLTHGKTTCGHACQMDRRRPLR